MASRSRAPVRRTQDLGAGPGTQSRVSGWPVEPGAPGDCPGEGHGLAGQEGAQPMVEACGRAGSGGAGEEHGRSGGDAS